MSQVDLNATLDVLKQTSTQGTKTQDGNVAAKMNEEPALRGFALPDLANQRQFKEAAQALAI